VPPELHITSCLVHARPEALAPTRAALAAMDGVEVHGASPDGKVVVTLETASEGGIVDRLAAMRDLPGVLSAVLVFHRVEAPSTSQGV
jgi:periplasmic nitrate reductase NapD